jgi:hypothetical protein
VKQDDKSPLEPMATGAPVALGLFIALTVAAVATTILGSGSLFGVGGSTACAVDPGLSIGGVLADRAAPGVSTVATEVRFCVGHPDAGQMVWQALTMIPGYVLAAGALFIVWQLLRRAGRHGIYTLAAAHSLRLLGWWLTIGGILAPAIEEVAGNQLLRTLTTTEPTLRLPDISPSILLVGLGVLTFTRIMLTSVQMHEDLEGTV